MFDIGRFCGDFTARKPESLSGLSTKESRYASVTRLVGEQDKGGREEDDEDEADDDDDDDDEEDDDDDEDDEDGFDVRFCFTLVLVGDAHESINSTGKMKGRGAEVLVGERLGVGRGVGKELLVDGR